MLKKIPPKPREAILILAVFLAIAFILNVILLEIFKQKSIYRAEHSLVGIIMLMGFFATFPEIKMPRAGMIFLFLVSIVPCYLGTVFPDLDIRLLGIGGHRNPLFHCGIVFFILLPVVKRFDSIPVTAMIAGFGVGLGSHLLWDLFDHADVRWIPGGTLDRLWIGGNGVLCLVLSKLVLSLRLKEPRYNS